MGKKTVGTLGAWISSFFFPQKKDDRIGEVLLYLCVFAVLFMVKKTEHCFSTVFYWDSLDLCRLQDLGCRSSSVFGIFEVFVPTFVNKLLKISFWKNFEISGEGGVRGNYEELFSTDKTQL